MSTATIRDLQSYVFNNKEEILITACKVNKFLKKKKISFLCLVSVTGVPSSINIVQIKQTDRQVFKRKRTWALVELKSVDGHNELAENLEFDLHLDKVYRWVALNTQERHALVHNLWKYSSKYILHDKPLFKNIPKMWITEDSTIPEKFDNNLIPLMDHELVEDFQVNTEKEQEDLKRLMSGCEFAISNAEAFMEVLARDLSLLDGENIHCVLASEDQVETLMEHLELALNEVGKMETQLNDYDEILCHVRDTMEKMEHKNSTLSTANMNNQWLMKELENLTIMLGKVLTSQAHELVLNLYEYFELEKRNEGPLEPLLSVQEIKLDLSSEHQRILEDADFTTVKGLAQAVEAANALKKLMNSDIDKSLLQMSAVQEQRKKFDKLKDKFARNICRQLNNLFIHFGNHKGESEKTLDGLTLPQHGGVHKELYPYTELIHWIKVMDKRMYESLKEVYTSSLGKLYDRDLKNLFTVAREKIAVYGNVVSPTTIIGLDRDQWTLETSTKDRERYDTVLEQVLTQLEPVFMQEQQFCLKFFQLDVIHSPNSSDNLGEAADAITTRKIEKQIDEDIRNMMSSLFACLKLELDTMIEHIKKQDNFYCMYVLVRLNQHVMSAQSSFLSNTFGSLLIEVKRSLDQFMLQQIESIKDCRISKKSKCGILPYVSNLEIFAKNANCLLKSDRGADLEKWYTRLVDTMLEYIALHAIDHKTPPQVIKMENYHHLYSLLSQLKIPVLDSQRKEAKQKYNDALISYVTLYFGRPLEKLNTFFEGVQARVASGIKASEVSYQLAFSKQELRKVINQYPGSQVKKGLESLYKKVEKHLSEEENLLQVVWRAMQEEFIRQYKTLEDLIHQCYPGSMVSLEFTIDDILMFFSDIAQSH